MMAVVERVDFGLQSGAGTLAGSLPSAALRRVANLVGATCAGHARLTCSGGHDPMDMIQS